MPCHNAKLNLLSRILSIVFLLTLSTLVQGAQSLTLAWDPCSDPDLTGHKLYYGTATGNYSKTNTLGITSTATVTGLVEGVTYYFAISVVNTSGLESGFSNEVMYQVPNGSTITPTIVWANPPNILYGSPLGSAQLNATANVPGTFAYTPPAGTILTAGNGQVLKAVFTPTDTSTYSKVTNTVSLNVTRAPLTITADNNSMTKGSTPPPLTATYSGFVNGDIAAQLATPAVLTTTATSSSAVGTYPITVSGATCPNYNITFVNGVLTVNAANSGLVTIWSSTTKPVVVDGGPDSAVELGVKFRADVAGTITGIRFYKATANTGTHVANLWTSSGTKLATATFTGETASGWQQVNFVTPVAITANTVYVASYHCNSGHYSEDLNYFATAGVDNPPLHALANGVSVNSVYRYGSSSLFPNQTWKSANYWVDVVFQSSAAPALVLPLGIESLALLPDGQSQLTVHGQPGRPYEILTSSDCVQWQLLHTDVVKEERFIYLDAEAVHTDHRFYQIRAGANSNGTAEK